MLEQHKTVRAPGADMRNLAALWSSLLSSRQCRSVQHGVHIVSYGELLSSYAFFNACGIQADITLSMGPRAVCVSFFVNDSTLLQRIHVSAAKAERSKHTKVG